MDSKTKKKIIIHCHDDIELDSAVDCVHQVISNGRVSEARGYEQFCFVTSFSNSIVVAAKEKHNENTDTFVVYKRQ